MSADLRVVAFMHAKPGEEDAVRRAVLDCVEPSRCEPGCTSYVAHVDQENVALFVVVEHWTTAAARARPLQSAHLQRRGAVVDSEHRLSHHVFHVLTPLDGP